MKKKNLEESGGVYIETTELHRWVLGDKTREIEKLETLEDIKKRTGLGLLISYLDDKVNVRVVDPDSVSRMLLCKNDDVGSLVKYADMKFGLGKVESIEELTASYGEHITIEPFNVSNIRVCVYPIGDSELLSKRHLADKIL